MVGRLDKVELRKVWSKEAKDFTAWLGNNLDILGEHIGLKLSLLEREKPVGTLSADLYAEGPNGDTVVIENQLEKTNHDHLGKIVTYLSNLETKTAIWITTEPRPEHATAIEWLNQVSPSDISFYLVKVEAFTIGQSEPAPLFTIVSGPSGEIKQIGERKEELAERQVTRIEFWRQLLDKAKERTNLHSNVSPSKDSWITAGAGRSGMGWSYSITIEKGTVELFIDRGPEKKDETDRIYGNILKNKENIEKEFGEPLIWDRRVDRRVCRIKSASNIGGLKNRDLWPEIQDDMIKRMINLEKALKLYMSNV